MTTRCLQKLDELDRVAEHVFRRHSRQRARSNVESRLESLRSKLQSYEDDIFGNEEERESQRSSNSNIPLSKHRSESSSRNFGSETSHVKFQKTSGSYRNKQNSARTTTPGKCATPVKQKPRSQSLPNCQQIKSQLKKNDHHKDAVNSLVNERPVSTYGSHGNDLAYDGSAWFNFKPGSSLGVIDAFACDEKNERPLCYKIDPKTGECQPRLLKHRSTVRIGQNGVFREVDCKEEEEEEMLLGEEGHRSTCDDEIGSFAGDKVSKKRTAPLSMEEQLNWENAHILSPRKAKLYQENTKNLCHQQPVVYKSQKSLDRTPIVPSVFDRTHEPKYRFCQERHPVQNPGGTGPNRNITSVTLQDFSDLITDEKDKKLTSAEKLPQDITKKDTLNKEKQKIQKRTLVGDKERTSLKGVKKEQKGVVMFLEQGSEDVRVSFSEPNSQDFDSETKTLIIPKQSRNTRPKSSGGKLHTPPNVQLFTENSKKKKLRPSTAPPSSPRLPQNVEEDMYKYISSYFPEVFPKHFDADVSNKESLELNKANNVTKIDEQYIEDESSSFHADNKHGLNTTADEHNGIEDLTIHEHDVRHQKKYLSNEQNTVSVSAGQKPVSVMNIHENVINETTLEKENSNEEEDMIVPMEALSSLRRKIKEDLEKQTRELEQDIQQLYLKQNQVVNE